MPTPFGHALAGLAVATVISRPRRMHIAAWSAGAVILACLPDTELLIGRIIRRDLHHGPFHTVPFAVGVGLVAAVLARGGPGNRFTWFGFASACVGSHVLLDVMRWTHPASLLEIFWPLSDRGVVLPLHLFHHSPSFEEARTGWGFRLLVRNIVNEFAILGTPLLILLLWKAKSIRFLSTDRSRA